MEKKYSLYLKAKVVQHCFLKQLQMLQSWAWN